MTKAKSYFTTENPQEINDLETQNLIITGQLNVSGITTLGLGPTSSPQLNSQMSFELTNNTTLTIRVKGTDGVLRSADITLS